jgi:hypothetical protein
MARTDYLLDLLGDGAVDLGGGHWARFIVRDEAKVGFFHVHPSAGGNHIPEGEPCAGGVNFDVPENQGHTRAVWQLHSLDPLHVEPSILCWEEC